jgi:L-fuconolactonase
MLIDSHHHLWRYSAQQYSWINDQMAMLQKDFWIDDLRSVAAAAGVDGFVTVQARQSLCETESLLTLANSEPLIKGIVGWVPLADREVSESLDRYAANSRFKGVRHVVQDEADERFLLRSDFNDGMAQLATRNLVYDLLIHAHQLAQSIEFVDRHPSQLMVVDHLAKPTIRADEFDKAWERNFRDLARRPHVYCKFSGVITEVRDHDWSIETIRPYWEVAIEAFSPRRLMFGSDWPVCLRKLDYLTWLEMVRSLAGELSANEQADLFANTAIKAYNL